MADQYYYNKPSGLDVKVFPTAPIAETVDSRELVRSHEEDAYFFRALEQAQIYLNRGQIAAVRHGEGPCLTLAGAGSGKTSVLVCRTGYLLSVRKVDPRQILLVTFTKKAATEMKERIAALPGMTRRVAQQIQARTFHSFFLTILKQNGYRQRIFSNERFKQIIMKQILREQGLQDAYQPETLFALLTNYKMNMMAVDDLPTTKAVDQELKSLFLKYEAWKRSQQQLDFDDILVEAYALLQAAPALLQMLQQRFIYVMVDEFQDTNLLQYELLKLIAKPQQNLFVVGDDDQTIYTFNGARNQFILHFDQEFPDAKTIILDINYRSGAAIVGLGNAMIQQNCWRREKCLKTTRRSEKLPQFSRPATTDEEAKWVVANIKAKVQSGSYQYGEMAILHRTTSSSRAIFEALTTAGLPFIHYSLGDQLFYEQWLIKPVIAHLRLALQPRDITAIAEILPSLYINREQGLQYIERKERQRRMKYPLIHLVSLPTIKSYQANKVKERIIFIKGLRSMKPTAAIEEIRTQFYDRFLEMDERQQATLHKESIKETLDELSTSAERFSTVEEFLSFIDQLLVKQQEMTHLRRDPQANAISVMTIHRAKGLEFPIVYLLGASEGILPHRSALEADQLEDLVVKQEEEKKLQLALEEERRLAYVAITRAMEELYISSPIFYRGKKVAISRFLREVYQVEAE